MFDRISSYQVFVVFLGIAGVGAIAFSAFGLVTILSGGVDSGDTVTFPDGFGCQEFNGDPDVGHETGYGIVSNTTLGALESFTANTTDSGFELRANVSEPRVLNVSARHPDGRAVPVESRDGIVRLTTNDTTPFRLWIDSAEGGIITRSTIDICPPTDG